MSCHFWFFTQDVFILIVILLLGTVFKKHILMLCLLLVVGLSHLSQQQESHWRPRREGFFKTTKQQQQKNILHVKFNKYGEKLCHKYLFQCLLVSYLWISWVSTDGRETPGSQCGCKSSERNTMYYSN